MTSTPPHMAGTVWIKKTWKLQYNPFPTTGIARLGGNDRRENGLLFDPGVSLESIEEATEKFVLGAAFSGLRFGYLWSRGVAGGDSDARGFGKSVLMQHLVWSLNQDFGRSAYLSCGLDEDDADEAVICGLLTSFDTSQIRSLGAAMFDAVEYATDFRNHDEDPTLVERLEGRLIEQTGTDDPVVLAELITKQQRALRGRTLGPPIEKLIAALVDEDPFAAADLLDKVSSTARTRNGAVYLATFLLFAAAAGVKHVLVCCDQLEDLASNKTVKSKRDLETERFRDVILETLPMADMVSVIVTMHPQAAATIAGAWQVADLPTFEISEANRHRVVELHLLRNVEQARRLLNAYLDEARKDGEMRTPGDVSPLTPDAIEAIFSRSNRKPRDVLRKAHGLIESAAADNLHVIDADAVLRYLDALAPDSDEDLGPVVPGTATSSPDWSAG